MNVDDNEVIFSELSELAQRRFLRQISAYSETITRPFPRLFVLDTISSDTTKSQVASKMRLTRTASIDTSSSGTKYCIKVLCEHENGWHPTGQPLNYDTSRQNFEAHYAYFIRIMTLIKHSKMTDLNILDNEELLDEYLIKAQEKLEKSSQDAAENRFISRSIRAVVVTDFKESFNYLSNFVQSQLDANKAPEEATNDNNSNPNLLKYFDLHRCILPSGKILWLCPEHRKDENIQTLTTDFGANQLILQNDEFNSIFIREN